MERLTNKEASLHRCVCLHCIDPAPSNNAIPWQEESYPSLFPLNQRDQIVEHYRPLLCYLHHLVSQFDFQCSMGLRCFEETILFLEKSPELEARHMYESPPPV